MKEKTAEPAPQLWSVFAAQANGPNAQKVDIIRIGHRAAKTSILDMPVTAHIQFAGN